MENDQATGDSGSLSGMGMVGGAAAGAAAGSMLGPIGAAVGAVAGGVAGANAPQIAKALPKVIEKTTAPELRRALENHLKETRSHVARLEQNFEMHGEEAKKRKCKGMQGVLSEGDDAEIVQRSDMG